MTSTRPMIACGGCGRQKAVGVGTTGWRQPQHGPSEKKRSSVKKGVPQWAAAAPVPAPSAPACSPPRRQAGASGRRQPRAPPASCQSRPHWTPSAPAEVAAEVQVIEPSVCPQIGALCCCTHACLRCAIAPAHCMLHSATRQNGRPQPQALPRHSNCLGACLAEGRHHRLCSLVGQVQCALDDLHLVAGQRTHCTGSSGWARKLTDHVGKRAGWLAAGQQVCPWLTQQQCCSAHTSQAFPHQAVLLRLNVDARRSNQPSLHGQPATPNLRPT